MGRQPKIGLDYFLFDVGLLNDPKLRKPRQTFGYLSEIVYIALLCILYRDKGYYIDYRGKKRDDVIWQVGEQITGRYTTSEDTIAHVITCLAECELFSGELFQAGIITSARAQKAYYSATSDRKNISVNFDWWLLSREDMEALSTKSTVLRSFISRAENNISGTENAVFGAVGTQSRVEQNREEKSREEKTRAEDSRAEAAALSDLAGEAGKIIGGAIDEGFRQELKRLTAGGMEQAVILHAAAYTAGKQAQKPPAYLRRILQGYERENIRTMTELEALHPPGPRGAAPACGGPDGKLEDWEKDWLAERQARMDARKGEN